ncbi:putative disease resistance protein RGA1 [Phoenix dactylifera]|uniref:Disease resistance protein RGA1 n=1 Tax=Phoenix dactylifera TaxID=42345 RepID=A0A8B9A2A5_PHODC|nr:putative disease resistance protein RGA1 [Phoenix dactylifera]
MSFRYFRSLENLYISAPEDLAPLLEEEEETRGLSSSLHQLEIKCCNWFFSPSQQSSSPLAFWKNLTSLQSLRMISCDDLVYWPEAEFRGLNSVKKIEISLCNMLVGPSHLPLSSSSSGDGELLPNLEHLLIQSCDGLQELPKLPASLRSLTVFHCPKLNSLTEDLRLLPNLEELDIVYCDGLLELPKLPASLRSLNVGFCPKINFLTEGLRHATSLESVKISNCPSLTSLPVDLGHLTALKKMDINKLPGLESLPQGLGQLAALECLSISTCSKLSSLPEGMQGLTALKKLSIKHCPRLSSLPEGLQRRLPGLQHLEIVGCPDLERQCKRGGPYWDLISRIPSTKILSERRCNFSASLSSFSCFRRPSTV